MATSLTKSVFLKPNTSTLQLKPHKPVVTCKFQKLRTSALGISETFAQLRQRKEVAFIPFITAGDPDLSTTAEALRTLDFCGSDIIELGVPHSDPYMDGPVIQAACNRALTRGTNFGSIITMLKTVVPQLTCPILLFTYYNVILEHGISEFMASSKEAGVHGLLVPDVPTGDIGSLKVEAAKNEIELVLIITPITPKKQMEHIVQTTEGFLYLVSTTGVTGVRPSINPEVESFLQEIKQVTSKPIVVGFGISKPEHVRQLAIWGADGVVVGSVIVKLLGEAISPEQGLKEVGNFTKLLKFQLLGQHIHHNVG